MYTSRTGLILGFHGTDKSIVDKIINNSDQDLEPKVNIYDWLGNGIYFWDNSPTRAMEWAVELSKKENSSIKEPAVIGAIIDLGHCLDLLDSKNFELLKKGHAILSATLNASDTPMPRNRGRNEDLALRELDCAVIESLHGFLKETGEREFDSARGVFWEGNPLYEGAGFKDKNHIQICVKNINCIKGYFKPLDRIIN
ncbi:hypothetical protein ACLI1A_06215 [Flavobacterium sp. RHBU_3]|uniref:hypothetical protein n=1 Tax=Flavobacterium sp. RHBU_3 TaxID=3391184 RepID=UPI003984C563